MYMPTGMQQNEMQSPRTFQLQEQLQQHQEELRRLVAEIHLLRTEMATLRERLGTQQAEIVALQRFRGFWEESLDGLWALMGQGLARLSRTRFRGPAQPVQRGEGEEGDGGEGGEGGREGGGGEGGGEGGGGDEGAPPLIRVHHEGEAFGRNVLPRLGAASSIPCPEEGDSDELNML